MRLAALNRRERRLLLLTVIVLGAALFYSIIFMPFAVKYKKLTRELELSVLELNRLNLLIGQKEQIGAIYDNYKTKLRTGKSDSEEIINILQEVNSIAEGKHLIVQDMKPLRIENAEYHKKYYIRIRVEGRLVPICSLIYDIQHSPQTLKVESTFLDLRPRTYDFRADFVITHIVSKENGTNA
jgi:Tfp pilus assembly protein PilO